MAILYVTVPIEFDGDIPVDYDDNLVCEKFAAYRDGTLVPLLKFKAPANLNGEVFTHRHVSNDSRACQFCQNLSFDGRN